MVHENSYKKGQKGEELALHYFEKQGFRLLAKNYKKKNGEIDLIMMTSDDIIVFIEVKYYKNNAMVAPEFSITPRKKSHLVRTAKHYIAQHNICNTMFRFDLIVVNENNTFTHYENIISN